MTGLSNNNVQSKVSFKGNKMTGSSNNNVQGKVSFKGNTMTGSSNNNVHSKVSFKGNTMTGSSNNNVHSKVSFKGNTMTGSSNNNVHITMQVHLTDQIRSIKTQCNAVYPKICFRKCHISVLGVEKYHKFSGGEYPQTSLLVHTIPHQTFCQTSS